MPVIQKLLCLQHLCIQSIHWYSLFQKTNNIEWHYSFLFTSSCQREGHMSLPIFPLRMVSETVWKTSTPYGPTCTAISRLVTNLDRFGAYLLANSLFSIAMFQQTPGVQHDFSAISLSMQYHIRCNMRFTVLENDIVMCNNYISIT